MDGRAPHPRALVVWCAAVLVCALITTNPYFRATTVLIALNVVLATRQRQSRLRPIAVAATVATVLTIVIQLLFSHAGSHVFIHVSESVPVIGGSITLESLAYGVVTASGVVAALLSVTPLAIALNPDDLIDALPRPLERTATALGGALTLVPRFAAATSAIADSHRVRGYRISRRARVRGLLMPALLSAIDDSVQLAEAMEVRGYGSGQRTTWKRQPWAASDVAVAGAACVAMAGVVIARITGSLADWYPFPSLTTPPLPFLAITFTLILLAPAVVWRR